MNSTTTVACPHNSIGKAYQTVVNNIFEKRNLLKKTCLDCHEEIPKPPGGPTVVCEKCWEPMGPLMGRMLPDYTRVQYSICTVCGAEYCIPIPQTGKRIIKIK
jgi:hypothetical protein